MKNRREKSTMKINSKTLSSMSGISGLLAFLALLLTLVAPVRAQEREYTTIAPTGARSSTAFGINALGTYIDQNFAQHGFLLRNGVFTVDFPGAQGTIARGINPRGEIVGSYRLPSLSLHLSAAAAQDCVKGR